MKNPPSYRMKSRMVIVLIGMIVFGFCVVIHSLFKLQVVRGQELQEKALSQQLQTKRIGAKRGNIYDSNGKLLAQSATIWQICISPGDVKSAADAAGNKEEREANLKKYRDSVADCLYNVLGLEKKKIYAALEDTSSLYKVVKKKVEQDQYEELMRQVKEGDIPGIFAEEMTRRYYPYDNLASTVLGFTNNDNVGATGLESYYEKTLAGTPGRVVSLRNRNGVRLQNQYEQAFDPKDGNSIVLTIDETLQHFLDKNLEIAVSEHRVKERVSGIIMDVKTGAILAMSSKPDFDPNNPYDITDPDMLAELEALKETATEKEYSDALWNAHNSLWRNKTISDPYEPGSVFKIVTLSTALETGAATPNSQYTCLGYKETAGHVYRCHVWNTRHAGHGTQSLMQAAMNSCNPAFIEIGQAVGAQRFAEYFSNFGLTEGTGIDLPGEANSIYHAKLSPSDLASSAFGQTNKLTPIQLITACSAAVNGGKLMQPYVVKQVVDSEGNVVSNVEPKVKRQVISEEISAEVREILEQVVANGSGRQSQIPGYRIGGKTGTSEKLDKKRPDGSVPNILSFFGFAPADDPQVACLVMLDEPDIYDAWGSTIAAPIVGSILADTLPYLGIEPQVTATEDKKGEESKTKYAPYEVNKDIHLAEYELRMEGLRYRVIGNGTKVVKQIPGAGEPVSPDGSVVLYTEEVTPDNMVIVPNIIGKSPEEVNSMLVGVGLNVSMLGEKLEGQSLMAISQKPEAGQEVATGSVVTVGFTVRPPSTSETVENTVSDVEKTEETSNSSEPVDPYEETE